jgi:hypothetical protein
VRSRRNLCHFLRSLERLPIGRIVEQARPRSKLVFRDSLFFARRFAG